MLPQRSVPEWLPLFAPFLLIEKLSGRNSEKRAQPGSGGFGIPTRAAEQQSQLPEGAVPTRVANPKADCSQPVMTRPVFVTRPCELAG